MRNLPGFTSEASLSRSDNHYLVSQSSTFAWQTQSNKTLAVPAAVRLVAPISGRTGPILAPPSLSGWRYVLCMAACLYACSKTGSPDCGDLCDFSCTLL
jgi:hypothetical protein